jgi:cytochrome c oxidase assembly protein subunit 15
MADNLKVSPKPAGISAGLRFFSKCVCAATLLLIFAGALVKSTESGLAVPDWPTSYGKWFFVPMVGGVKYEHGHRLIAEFVGLLTLILCLWLIFKESRLWVKITSVLALFAVILQGILGGLTVLHYLPPPVSVAHGTLAQIFFLITIFLAYSLSLERESRLKTNDPSELKMIKASVVMTIMLLIQLILGAVVRHTQSGLAIPDFPKMGGSWLPIFNDAVMAHINDWRFENDMPSVSRHQAILHFSHRFWAFLITLKAVYLNIVAFKYCQQSSKVTQTVLLFDILLAFQILLGIGTVMSVKEVYTTTSHVLCGAALFGLSFLLVLRSAPVRWSTFKKTYSRT